MRVGWRATICRSVLRVDSWEASPQILRYAMAALFPTSGEDEGDPVECFDGRVSATASPAL
ncbi:MAG: hypothetical protein MOB07_29715 [Acidobacteria bacterium]|nr:hypothetical protein [Acidobacteriota bacterium]